MDKYHREITIRKDDNQWIVSEGENDKSFPQLLDSLLEVCNDKKYDKSFFRGQGTPLAPVASIFREDYKHILENEIEYYSTIISDHSSELIGIEDVIDFFSILQHYGCPTRLLDITKNPMVAIQFMISGEYKKEGHTLFIFDPINKTRSYMSLGAVNDIQNFKKECEFPILSVGNSKHKNLRIETQKGLFIYFDEKNNHNNNISNLLKQYNITRITIMFNEANEREELKKDLEKYHYYNYNLYPDLVSKSNYYKNGWKKETKEIEVEF